MGTERPRKRDRAKLPLGFWDTSAIIPLCCRQTISMAARQVMRSHGAQIVWWGTHIEAVSAIYRLAREGGLKLNEPPMAIRALEVLRRSWHEISPSDEVLQTAERLLRTHPLRADDALQLAAALTWCGNYARRRTFICADARLSAAADEEGFNVIRL
jgi:predicted nucleic acid-binding protein